MRGMKRFTRMSRAEWSTGVLAAVVVGLTLTAALGDAASVKDKKVKAISNCRMLVVALKIYAADQGGRYPDEGAQFSNSNQAFRSLFEEFVLDTEAIFGCPDSVFVPDGNIGKAPDFSEALKAGENHWAMTAGLTDASSGRIPLVYENPATAGWPAKWHASTGGTRTKGQAWSDDTVIVGLNDLSVVERKLGPGKKGSAAALKPYVGGEEVFDSKQQHTILDVEPAKEKP
jgi:hypothetical protein